MKISSEGMFGMCTIPSTVSKRAAMKRLDGISPTVRSVPGPSKCSASKRRSVSRPAVATSASARPPGGDGILLVQAAHVHELADELGERGVVVEIGVDQLAHGRLGQGPMLQLVVRSFTTRPVSPRNGS